MKKNIFSLFLFLFLSYYVCAQTFPVVINNTNIPPLINLIVRSSTHTTDSVRTSISINNKLVANNVVSGGSAANPTNGQTTTWWYKVDLPGTSSPGYSGYIAAGTTFTNPDCNTGYVKIVTTALNVRTTAGGTTSVTIGGSPAQVYNGQYFAVNSSTTSGGVVWYQIYLPDVAPPYNCSQEFGWVSSGGGAYAVYHPPPTIGLPTPIFISSNYSSTIATLNWSMNYCPSNVTYLISGTHSGTVTGSSALYTDTSHSFSATPCTPYSETIQAKYGTCVSNITLVPTFTTTCSCPSITVTKSQSNVTLCNGNTNGSITVSANGGVSPYSYSKDGGSSYQSPNTFSVLAAGIYTIKVKDNNNCPSSNYSDTITQPPAVNFTYSITNACSGCSNGSITLYASGGTSPYQYSKNGGGIWQTSDYFPGLSAGSYSVLVKDVNNCSPSSQNANILQPPLVTSIGIVYPGSNNIYVGQNLTFSGTVYYSPSSYAWTVSGGSPYTTRTFSGSVPTISFPNPGSYAITLQTSNSAGAGNIYSTGVNFITVQPTPSNMCVPPNTYPIQESFPGAQVAEPIWLATKSYGHKHTDFDIKAIKTNLNFTRLYNTVNDTLNSSFGYGWSHTYDYYISNPSDSFWSVHYGDGHTSSFIPFYNGGGTSFALYGGTYDTLTKSSSTGLFTLKFKTGEVLSFNSAGKLGSIIDLNGNTTTLNYSGNNLISIVAPGGRSLMLNYTASHVTSISDQLGRTAYFGYTGGDLTSARDLNAQTVAFTYDGMHRITLIHTARGDTMLTNVYDSQGNIDSQTDGLHNTTAIAYNSPSVGDAVVTYPDNSTSTTHHDVYYRLTNQTDELGHSKTLAYDYNNNLDSIVDENNNLTTFSYDAIGNCLNAYQPLNTTTQFTYNSFNKPTIIVDPLLQRDSLLYDNNGDVTDFYFPDGSSLHLTYSNGLLKTSTDRLHHLTSYYYNSFGDLDSVFSPRGVQSFTHDATGRTLTSTNENGHTTYYTYDSLGNLTVIRYPLGDSVQYAYDEDNNKVAFIDGNGFQTGYTYDIKDRLTNIHDPETGNTVIGYDTRDNVHTVKDANNHTASYEHDTHNRLTSASNSLGTSHFGYDFVGNKTSDTDATGVVKLFSYDALNRCTSGKDAFGDSARLGYGPSGLVASITDPMNRTTGYNRTPTGLVNLVTAPLTPPTYITYDSNGQKLSIINANTFPQYFRYDVSSRLKGYTDENSFVDSFVHDGVGNLLQQIKPTGTVTKNYNTDNRLNRIVNAPGDIDTFGYDNNKNITSIFNSTGPSSFVYDSLNHLRKYIDMYSDTVSYTRDHVGNKQSVTYPGGFSVTYLYNAANLLDSVMWPGHLITYQYNPNGKLAQINYPNGIMCRYAYDLASRLDSQITSKGSILISQSAFTLNAAGERINEARAGPIAKHFPNSTSNYAYEKNNHIIAAPGITYTFDGDGNRQTILDSTGTTTYTFSADDLLYSITGTSYAATYHYNAFGDQVECIASGVTRRYVIDYSGRLPQPLQEKNSLGITIATNIYGVGLVARIDSSGNTLYYHFDPQHNTVALSNDTGLIADTYTYLSSGKVWKHTGTTLQPFTFLGEYAVRQETKTLYQVGVRYYDASDNGIFVSIDQYPSSIINPQTLNKYMYGLNNPISKFDPTGLCVEESSDNKTKKDSLPINVNSSYSLNNVSAIIPNRTNVGMFNNTLLFGVTGEIGKGFGSLQPLGLGSTGRTIATTLNEQLAMEEIMSNPSIGTKIIESIKDPIWEGWTKMAWNNAGVEIHYVVKWTEDGLIEAVDDFKIIGDVVGE